MQWDEEDLDTQFIPNVYFWTPNSEILAKALLLCDGVTITRISSQNLPIWRQKLEQYRSANWVEPLN